MLLLSPILARTLAADGWSKDDVKQYLFDHARITAQQFEQYVREWVNRPVRPLMDLYGLGKIPKDFVGSDDPERLVPLVFEPDDFMIAVAGDPLRTNAYTFSTMGSWVTPSPRRSRIRLRDGLLGNRAGFARNAAISSELKPNSVKISSVCSPIAGGARLISGPSVLASYGPLKPVMGVSKPAGGLSSRRKSRCCNCS